MNIGVTPAVVGARESSLSVHGCSLGRSLPIGNTQERGGSGTPLTTGGETKNEVTRAKRPNSNSRFGGLLFGYLHLRSVLPSRAICPAGEAPQHRAPVTSPYRTRRPPSHTNIVAKSPTTSDALLIIEIITPNASVIRIVFNTLGTRHSFFPVCLPLREREPRLCDLARR